MEDGLKNLGRRKSLAGVTLAKPDVSHIPTCPNILDVDDSDFLLFWHPADWMCEIKKFSDSRAAEGGSRRMCGPISISGDCELHLIGKCILSDARCAQSMEIPVYARGGPPSLMPLVGPEGGSISSLRSDGIEQIRGRRGGR